MPPRVESIRIPAGGFVNLKSSTIGTGRELSPPRALPVGSAYQFKTGPYSSHSRLLQFFPPSAAGRRVLDLGCADGYLARILGEKGCEVVGLDKHVPDSDAPTRRVKFAQADLDSGIPSWVGSFDYALCADILEHLRDPLRLLIDLRARLAPDGGLIASLPNSGNLYFRLNILMGRFPAHNRGLFDRTHLHFYTWDGWVDLFRRAGFRIERAEPTGVPVGLALPKWQNTLTVHLLEWMAYVLARIWKSLFAYQFVIVARPEARR
jgi:SAM-dependent methyltransferase